MEDKVGPSVLRAFAGGVHLATYQLVSSGCGAVHLAPCQLVASVFPLVVVVVDGEVHGSFDGCLHMIIMARTFQLLWSRRDGVMRVSSPKPCPIFDFSGGYRLPQASSARGSVRLVQREYL